MHNIGCLRTCEVGSLRTGTSAVCSKRLIFTKGGGDRALNCLCDKTVGGRRARSAFCGNPHHAISRESQNYVLRQPRRLWHIQFQFRGAIAHRKAMLPGTGHPTPGP